MQNTRKSDLAQIHILKSDLALDDDTYRDLLWTLTRQRSAADLDQHGRRQVIRHLRAKLPQGKRRRGRKFRDLSQAPADRQALIKKIRALLIQDKRPDSYADGVARNMFQVDQFQWCNPRQLHKIAAALQVDRNRRSGGAP